MNAAVKDVQYEVAYALMTTIRSQMERMTRHGLKPGAVLMSALSYKNMEILADNEKLCHNKDINTVNGLPIVIYDVAEPVVTATPDSMRELGLL